MEELHIDIETYSSIDIKSCGSYRYLQSVDFEILLVAYAFNQEPTRIIDLAQGEKLPIEFIEALEDPAVTKHAHNAVFQRQAFKNYGYDIPVDQWVCSSVKAAYCGLPLSLGDVSKALNFGEDKAKLATGRALIKYFCTPCKPTKVNGGRNRNLPKHDIDKWEEFKNYCVQDVEAEREVDNKLSKYKIPETERALYILDQKINDRGILIDTEIALNAFNIDEQYASILTQEVKDLTGIDNPNSPAQLKEWIGEAIGKEVKSLAKDLIPTLIEEADNETVGEVLLLRQKLSKSSTKKYTAMLNCVCEDGRGHGLFQFYGANRTGRWAGRLIQLQNLPQNHLANLDLARETIKEGIFENTSLLYDDIASLLSQLIRTAFIAEEGKTFAVADFSAIEARVIAWLASEEWRLEVFQTHGKIYEASASMMFNVPLEDVTKGSDYRAKGKVAELALGYQGALGALKTMGGEKMGLSDPEMEMIVAKWRKANPEIVKLWKGLEKCAKQAVKTRKKVKSDYRGVIFDSDGHFMTIQLPSGRKLFYNKPQLKKKRVTKDNGESFEVESITYMGMNQTTKQWIRLDTYGGKLTENIVQAIARDLLAHSMTQADKAGFDIVMHVHDEMVCEVDLGITSGSELEKMCEIMGEPVLWAEGLPLAADGYLTPYYKKD